MALALIIALALLPSSYNTVQSAQATESSYTINAIACIDYPSDNATVTGTINITGWALNSSGVSRIDIYAYDSSNVAHYLGTISGTDLSASDSSNAPHFLGSVASSDLSARADVAFAYASVGYGSTIDSGWSLSYDTSSLTPGTYTLAVAVIGNNSEVQWVTKTITIAAAYDNSTLAKAAVSLANAQNQYENSFYGGTALYKKVLEAIFPGDPYYCSCDRCIATIVRWSGSDDDYPIGNVLTQLLYLVTSNKWEEITYTGDDSVLQPGDIGIRVVMVDGDLSEHTWMYVGNDLLKATFGDAVSDTADTVQASYDKYSPCASNHTTAVNWRIFRLIKSDNSTTYANAAD